MRATVMHGRHDVQIENVNNATIQEPTGECRVRQSSQIYRVITGACFKPR